MGSTTHNKIIHERARLGILTSLAGSEKNSASFNELKESLKMTSGNLSIQVKKLEQAGYLRIKKEFRDNKPYTSISITKSGFTELIHYLEEMEELLKSLKK